MNAEPKPEPRPEPEMPNEPEMSNELESVLFIRDFVVSAESDYFMQTEFYEKYWDSLREPSERDEDEYLIDKFEDELEN